MLSQLHCAHFGAFAALTRGLSAFLASVFPSGRTVGIAFSVLSEEPKNTPI
jgi:nitrate/nitrite transporter NarK